jgi:hypothetical protein
MASRALGEHCEFTILEGLYLRSTRTYVALIETSQEDAIIIGDYIEPHRAAFPKAADWQRLSAGLGQMLSEGKLAE